MKKTAEMFWYLVQKQCSKYDDELRFDASSGGRYINSCEKEYKVFKRNYMNSDTKSLDRHKVAAILVRQGIELDIIKPTKSAKAECDGSGKLFIGREKVLLCCGLSYLVQQVNRIIEKSSSTHDKPNKMTFFPLPKALSCETKWIDIMSRTLYYNKQNNELSMLSLSEEFFLLEQIAIRDFYGSQSEVVLGILAEDVKL